MNGSTAANNAPGQLDETFGIQKDGKVFIGAQGITGQSLQWLDGHYFTVGCLNDSANLGSVRHNNNGLFSTDYGVVAQPSSLHGSVYAIAAQFDGRLVVLGGHWVENSKDQAFLARFSTNGILDRNFGDGGLVLLSEKIDSNFVSNFGLALQMDGKIVAAFTDGSSSVIIRLDQNGQRDNTFAGNGKVELPNVDIQSLVIHAGGLLVGGRHGSDGIVRRYLDNGTQDMAFANKGTYKLSIEGARPSVVALAIASDGTVTLAGTDSNVMSQANFVARLLPDGKPDARFNQGVPLVTAPDPINSLFQALAVQADGKALVLSREYGSGTTVYVTRYNPNGARDGTFGTAGTTLVYQDPSSRKASNVDKIQVQRDGKILVSGSFKRGSFMARLND